MAEADTINPAAPPVTVASLSQQLAALGVEPGMTVLMHTSLSALGWVCGGPVAVILALEERLGPDGTLVMPTQTGDLSDPEPWQNPPVPAEWWQVIRDNMPAYQPELTPTRGMGAVPECFRRQPGVLRSDHPQVSFAAWGRHARAITANHALTPGLGEQSPLARIYDLDGRVLLLGVGHGNNTSLHLAEARANFPGKQWMSTGAPMLVDGQRRWVAFNDLALNDFDFNAIGEAFARATGLERQGPAGAAVARLMPQRALVDFAVQWMEANRR